MLLLTIFTISCAEDQTQEGDVSVYKASLYPYIGEGEAEIYVSKHSDTHFFKKESMKKIGEYFDEKGSEYSSMLALSKRADMKKNIYWKSSKNVIFTEANKDSCVDNGKEIILLSDIHYSEDRTLAYFTRRKLCTGSSDNDASIITLRKDKVSCTDLNIGINLCTDWVGHSQSYINGI